MISIRIFVVHFILLSLIGSISTQSSIIISDYSSELTLNSEKYSRHGANGENFYYQAIPVQVNTTGTYIFTTSSTIGDTFGYLYQGNFYPSYPQYNIITQDDDTARNAQFQLTAILRSDITYILVFTTFSERATGSFNIVASGPDNVFNPREVVQTTTEIANSTECTICETSSYELSCFNCVKSVDCWIECDCYNEGQTQVFSSRIQLEANTGRRCDVTNNNGILACDKYCI